MAYSSPCRTVTTDLVVDSLQSERFLFTFAPLLVSMH